MRRIIGICLILLGGWNCFAGAIDLKDNDAGITISNDFFQIFLNAAKGYAIDNMKISGRQLNAAAGLAFSTDGELPKYIGRFSTAPRVFSQAQAQVKHTICENSQHKAVVKLDWNFPAGNVSDVITCQADSPLIRHDVELSFTEVMFEAYYQIDITGFSSAGGESIFYPDKRRVPGVWNTGFFSPCPAYKYAWNPEKRTGLGLLGPEGQDFVSIHYFMRGSNEGWSSDLTSMQLSHRPLRYVKLPGQVRFSFYVIAGGNPEMAGKLAALQLPAPKAITIDTVWPQKLVVRPGQDNITTVQVTNNSTDIKNVKLISRVLWDVNCSREVDNRLLKLAPGETGKFEIKWNTAGLDYGVAFRTEAYIGDGLVDRREEYCAVSNFAPAVAGISILTPGNCNQEGSEAVWVERMRRGYIGIFEYYVWAPSMIGGLTPHEDRWEPHTEAQGVYRSSVSKKFIKTLIQNAHADGIGVYAMITGLFNFNKGLEEPKLFEYCANGQPAIYNGKVYGDTRFAVAKANAYSEDFAYKWGQEMARSVEMFGWDGCRWDWSFLPSASNDPFYEGGAGEKQVADWYDDKGTPSVKIYPDPDTVAAKAVTAWRRGVNEKYPDFIFGVNGFATAKAFSKNPKFSAARSGSAMQLLEYRLDFTKPDKNTFQKWAEALTGDAQRIRAVGGQPFVGSMRGLLPGTVSRNLAQYVCFSSGVKWWEVPALPDGIDQSYKCYRFMIRFSEYYFDPGFKLLTEVRRNNEIKVDGSSRIFWQQFVYERPVNNGREVTVHLINLPENSDYICERHAVPPVRKNVAITAVAGEKEIISEVYALLPNPRPDAIRLEVKGNTAILPELEDTAIILFKFKK